MELPHHHSQCYTKGNVAGLCDSNIIIHNKELRNKFQEEIDNYSIEPNVFGLTACLSAYTKGDKWAKDQNEYLYENYKIVKDYFKENVNEAKVYILENQKSSKDIKNNVE